MSGNAMWRRVAEDVAARIVDGTYPIGSRIPTFEQLHQQYGVSVGTARKAIDILRAHGVIQGESGVGLFVASLPPDSLDPPDRIAALEERQGWLEAMVRDLYGRLGMPMPGDNETGDSHGDSSRPRRAAGQ